MKPKVRHHTDLYKLVDPAPRPESRCTLYDTDIFGSMIIAIPIKFPVGDYGGEREKKIISLLYSYIHVMWYRYSALFFLIWSVVTVGKLEFFLSIQS